MSMHILLRPGETIRDSDELYDPEVKKWLRVGQHLAGNQYSPDLFHPIRRYLISKLKGGI